ncbi:ABC transporter ATP-binding protein [Streptomyces smyrnaeus]|uniref:ABC transporter ATP-binding protein n=1 Tax=Streptomyces smyrnaeus TaxID=1387713 RepID=UPI003681FCB6
MLGRRRAHRPARPTPAVPAAAVAPAGCADPTGSGPANPTGVADPTGSSEAGAFAVPAAPAAPGHPALELHGVSRSYGGRRALDSVDLLLPRGRFLAVMGRSGSGKSTMLNCAAGLDRPTEGTVTIGGTNVAALGERDRTRMRRDRVGFVFQELNLLPALSVRENVALPLLLAEEHGRNRTRERDPLRCADRALALVGLEERAEARPAQLSGGQRQRVAVARALVTAPEVVLADEPTGALDPVTAHEVLDLLRRTVTAHGPAVLMVTHDPAAAAAADRTVFLAAGRITATLEHPSPAEVLRELARW